MRRTIVVGLLFPLLAGCYSYVPMEPAAAVAPARVRVQISPRATTEVGAILGRERHTLEGELVERTEEGFHIEVESGVGMAGERLRQRLVLAEPDLLGMQRRELDRTRSYLTAAGATVLIGFLVYQGFHDTAGSTPDGTLGPFLPEARIPLTILRFR